MLSVIVLTRWVGGTLYQMLVIVPLWGASPPESVRAFFQGTDYNRTIVNFFGPPFIVVLLLATACFTLFGAIFTIFSVYPINAVLFEQAGANRSGEEIQAPAWIVRDRVRFTIGLVGFAALLHAFRLPIAPDRR